MNPGHKKYILENIGKKSIANIAGDLHLKEKVVRRFLEREKKESISNDIINRPEKSFFEKHAWLFIGAILLASFIIRLIYINQLSHSIFNKPFGLDEEFYDNWGLSISRGQIIGKTVFYGLPLYPYFIGLLYRIFGHSIFVVRFAQTVIGTLNCFLVYLIGKNVFSKKAALISAAIFSFYGLFVFYEGQLISVTLSIFLNLLVILLLMRSFQNKRKSGVFLSGILIGFSSLAMSGILAICPFVIFGIFRFFNKKSVSIFVSMILLTGVLCPIGLAAIHNYIAEKDIVFVTAHGGITFYTGNNPNAKPYFSPIKEIDGTDIQSFIEGSRGVAERDLKRHLRPSEVSSYWMKKAVDFIVHNPPEYTKLMFQKFLFLYNSSEIQDISIDYVKMKKYTPILGITFLNFFIIIPFAILGIGLHLKLDKKTYLLYSYIISYSLAVILFMVNSRYRLPLLPVFIIFAGYGVCKIYETFRVNKKVPMYYLMVLLISAIFANLPLSSKATAEDAADYNVIGLQLIDSGDLAKAIKTFQKGIDLDPHNFDLFNSLGQAYFYKGMMVEAEQAVKKAIDIRTDFPEAHNTLGIIYKKNGVIDKSLEEFRNAVRLRPNSSDFHFNLGNTYLKKGQFDPAIEEYKTSLNIFEKPEYYNQLGVAYINKNEKEKALDAWQKALKLNNNFQAAKNNIIKYNK